MIFHQKDGITSTCIESASFILGSVIGEKDLSLGGGVLTWISLILVPSAALDWVCKKFLYKDAGRTHLTLTSRETIRGYNEQIEYNIDRKMNEIEMSEI